MPEPSTDEMARYPFLKESGQYLKSQYFSLKDFGTNPDLKGIVTKAHDRVIAARQGSKYTSEIPPHGEANETILQKEIFSFLIATVLIKLSGVRQLIPKFSLRESISAEKYLERDLKIADNLTGGVLLTPQRQHSRMMAVQIIQDISGVQISKPAEESLGGRDMVVYHDDWLVSVPDYLIRAVHFHEREWKLINRRVHGGKVYLSSHETVRIIRKELSYFIQSRINSMPPPDMYEQFAEPVEELMEWGRYNEPVIITSTEYPPCIKHAINVLEKGENLSHSGRFMLATYLLNRGQTAEEIAPLFKNAPDYNETITKKQLASISGRSGSETRYLCPSCDKIRINNLCFATSECNGIINPMQFGRRRA